MNNFNVKNCIAVISISIVIYFIMGILASCFSAPYIIEANTQEAIISNYKAGLIFHTWDFSASLILFIGLGISFWRYRLAPLCFTISILQLGKVLDLYIGDAYRYNFHEKFFFFNLFTWFIYTTFTWKFKNFNIWYLICLMSHLTLMTLYCYWPIIFK